ncbi:hypothetical protein I4U23_023512 [Adineta vaga]|nr:hypothetical protein I4U23_023512 [Adineta vaga]
MLSFIRKRLPSKDQSYEHEICKERNNEQIKQVDLEEDSRVNERKKKKKEKMKPSINELVISSSIRANQSYSDIDYLPMSFGGLTKATPDSNISETNDCYINPSDINQINRDQIHMPAIEVNKSQVINHLVAIIPKNFDRK